MNINEKAKKEIHKAAQKAALLEKAKKFGIESLS
jgi:hypothetical protein